MTHACAECKYYYETECNKSRSVYNALIDDMQIVTIIIKGACCGYIPGGIAIDKEAPRCKDFEK